MTEPLHTLSLSDADIETVEAVLGFHLGIDTMPSRDAIQHALNSIDEQMPGPTIGESYAPSL